MGACQWPQDRQRRNPLPLSSTRPGDHLRGAIEEIGVVRPGEGEGVDERDPFPPPGAPAPLRIIGRPRGDIAQEDAGQVANIHPHLHGGRADQDIGLAVLERVLDLDPPRPRELGRVLIRDHAERLPVHVRIDIVVLLRRGMVRLQLPLAAPPGADPPYVMERDVVTSIAPEQFPGEGQHHPAMIHHLDLLRGLLASDLFGNQEALLRQEVDEIGKGGGGLSLAKDLPQEVQEGGSPPRRPRRTRRCGRACHGRPACAGRSRPGGPDRPKG